MAGQLTVPLRDPVTPVDNASSIEPFFICSDESSIDERYRGMRDPFNLFYELDCVLFQLFEAPRILILAR
jgi:hypothetical protein